MKLIEKCEKYIEKFQNEQKTDMVFVLQKILDDLTVIDRSNRTLYDDLKSLADRDDVPADIKMKLGNWMYYSDLFQLD